MCSLNDWLSRSAELLLMTSFANYGSYSRGIVLCLHLYFRHKPRRQMLMIDCEQMSEPAVAPETTEH